MCESSFHGVWTIKILQANRISHLWNGLREAWMSDLGEHQEGEGGILLQKMTIWTLNPCPLACFTLMCSNMQNMPELLSEWEFSNHLPKIRFRTFTQNRVSSLLSPFISMDFEGLDCLGLHCLVYSWMGMAYLRTQSAHFFYFTYPLDPLFSISLEGAD